MFINFHLWSSHWFSHDRFFGSMNVCCNIVKSLRGIGWANRIVDWIHTRHQQLKRHAIDKTQKERVKLQETYIFKSSWNIRTYNSISTGICRSVTIRNRFINFDVTLQEQIRCRIGSWTLKIKIGWWKDYVLNLYQRWVSTNISRGAGVIIPYCGIRTPAQQAYNTASMILPGSNVKGCIAMIILLKIKNYHNCKKLYSS